MDKRVWWPRVHGIAESDMTEHAYTVRYGTFCRHLTSLIWLTLMTPLRLVFLNHFKVEETE